MDSADNTQLNAALRSQGERLFEQEDQLNAMGYGLRELNARHDGFQSAITSQVSTISEQLQQLTTCLEQLCPAIPHTQAPAPTAQPTVPAPPLPVPVLFRANLSPPEKFSGNAPNCRAFLVQCGLHFDLQPDAFPTERSRVAYIITHLTGRAEAWATAEWANNSPVCQSVELFSATLKKIFDHSTPGPEAARTILSLRQGSRPVVDYAIQFRTLAADCGWNPSSLLDAFHYGLSDAIKDQMVALDLPRDLDSLISLAIKIDLRLKERERDRSTRRASPTRQWGEAHSIQGFSRWYPPRYQPAADSHPASSTGEEPMQLGRTRLSQEERQRRLQEGRCIYCGQKGHFLARCPVKGRAPQ